MFKIYDGRETFYQWDLNRKIIIEDNTIDEVHFCNKTDDCSLVVKAYKEGELSVADVPNILLQTDWPIRVYGYCGGCYTKQSAVFKVAARSKPADYVYTEVELWNAEKAVEEALTAAKESGDFKGDKGDKGDAGSIKFTVVTELPAEDDGSTIFLVPSGEGEEGNAYDEYIYNNGTWEQIGSASVEVNLDEYVKKTNYAGTSANAAGVLWFDAFSYMSKPTVNNGLRLAPASETLIKNKPYGSAYAPITCSNYEFAVKTAMTNSKEWTDEEKAAAQNKLGLGDIETALDSIIAMQENLIGGADE